MDAKQPNPPPVYDVAGLTRDLDRLLKERFEWIQVRGEISNYKKAPSGHVYFRLKDGEAVLECVAWRSTAARWGGLGLRDGLDVTAGGGLSIYPPRGQYQLVVDSIRPAGAGALQQQFEELKRRLAAEGIFEESRKKPLPPLPARVALVTSPTGAAVRDFLETLRSHRCPARVLVCPVQVQGLSAAGEIAETIRWINGHIGADAIAVCRGGGSIEDLWAFNEEAVARAIFESKIPVIAGIGHEIDFTIADFAADVRAPTPTAAAGLIAHQYAVQRTALERNASRLAQSARTALDGQRGRFELSRRAIRRYHPMASVEHRRQRLDDLAGALIRAMRDETRRGRPALKSQAARLERAAIHALDGKKRSWERTARILEGHDFRRILARGYAICRDGEGRILTDAAETAEGARLDIRLARGTVLATADEVKPGL